MKELKFKEDIEIKKEDLIFLYDDVGWNSYTNKTVSFYKKVGFSI
ncbi:MAG: hypothetical protein ACRCYE_03675 [Sarcina sp.]